MHEFCQELGAKYLVRFVHTSDSIYRRETYRRKPARTRLTLVFMIQCRGEGKIINRRRIREYGIRQTRVHTLRTLDFTGNPACVQMANAVPQGLLVSAIIWVEPRLDSASGISTDGGIKYCAVKHSRTVASVAVWIRISVTIAPRPGELTPRLSRLNTWPLSVGLTRAERKFVLRCAIPREKRATI